MYVEHRARLQLLNRRSLCVCGIRAPSLPLREGLQILYHWNGACGGPRLREVLTL